MDRESRDSDIVQTGWPDVNRHLAQELRDDLYVQEALRQTDPADLLYVTGASDARNAMRVWPQSAEYDVWLEAREEGARALLKLLPTDRDVRIEVGTLLGLQMVQEEIDGVLSVGGTYCFVDGARFTPQRVCEVSALGIEDREALERYPQQCPVDWGRELEDVEKGTAAAFGCWSDGQIVGYSTAWAYNGIGHVDVDVRPGYRGRGYGRSLLSAATENRLASDRTVLCHCCMEAMANLRVSLAVGFAPLRQTFYYQGRRR